MRALLLVALGGAIGSVARHLVNVWSVQLAGTGFAWGTLTVNLAGSFAIGFLVETIARRFGVAMELRLFVLTGILGGFTTFSSFALDAVALLERGEAGLALAYVAASLVLSLAAVFAGLALGRALF